MSIKFKHTKMERGMNWTNIYVNGEQIGYIFQNDHEDYQVTINKAPVSFLSKTFDNYAQAEDAARSFYVLHFPHDATSKVVDLSTDTASDGQWQQMAAPAGQIVVAFCPQPQSDAKPIKYSFVAGSVNKVDVQRICNENSTAGALLLTSPTTPAQGLLLLNEKFLAHFIREQGVTVWGETLKASWGFPAGSLSDVAEHHWTSSLAPLTNWRSRSILLEQAADVRTDLKAARERLQQVKVTVEVL